MRTRNVTSNATLPADQDLVGLNGGTQAVVHTTAPFVYESLNETIIDEEPKKQYSGSCLHTKVETRMLSSNVDYIHNRSQPPAADLLYHTTYGSNFAAGYWVGNNLGTWLGSAGFTTAGFDWDASSYDAMQEMRASIGNGMLLPNFIAELAEMGLICSRNAKDRIQHAERARIKAERDRARAVRLEQKLQAIQARDGNLRKLRLPPPIPGPTIWNRTVGVLGRLARKIAWVNLAYQFAVRPTISDAKRLAGLMDSYRSKLSELIRRANKLQVRHYGRRVDGFSLPSEALVHRTSNWGNHDVIRQSEVFQRPKYRATMVYTFDATRLRSMLGQIDNLIHALGVSKVASVIWEAIPFSFVVDWFVNVGDMIASVEDQLLDPLPILVHDFSASLKSSYRTKLILDIAPVTTPTFHVRVDLAQRTFSVYERRAGRPCLYDSLSVRTPGLNQIGLGLSIIVLRMVGVTKERRMT
jgi:hypothetical protein